MNRHVTFNQNRYDDARYDRVAGEDLGRDHSRPLQMRPPSRVVTSESLFHGLHEIGIDHGGALYRLKITRQGKLILNK